LPWNIKMRIIRIFPRKTSATPNDELAIINRRPGFYDEADEIHISVAFEWDLKRAEELAKYWGKVANVKIGGPALNEPGGDFVPGRYLKKGYILTSRGCPNRCWFCKVWIREGGDVRELPITEGNNILDDNLLACSKLHILNVFNMLKNQKQIQFTGGLEALKLREWHVKEFKKLSLSQLFFAYDTPDDLEPLIEAGKLLNKYEINWPKLRAYVFMGWPEDKKRKIKADTFENAEKRLYETISAGFMPMAMLMRDENGNANYKWKTFQRSWARPAMIYRMAKNKNLI